MTALTIYGVDPSGDLWLDRDGDMLALTRVDVGAMMLAVIARGTTKRAGFAWDESQVQELRKAIDTQPSLWECRDCHAAPVLSRLDDRCDSCGVAHDEASDRISWTRSVGA